MFEGISKSTLGQWFSQRWVYHSIFWLSYTGMWHLIAAQHPFTSYSLLISALFMIVDVSAAYTNMYVLLPRFFYKKAYLKYAFLFMANIAFFVALMLGLWSFLEFSFFGSTSVAKSKYVLSSVFGSVMGVVTITMLVKLGKRSLETERKNEELEKEKLATELKFLKSQLNPHFLFNALNSIYFLIKKDQDTAAAALANFSDMLRYQIYECNGEKISLAKELEFLQNFIHLSQLRKNENFELQTSFAQNVNGEMLSPLILIPFVENAFKHVSTDKAEKSWIHIDLQLQGKKILFEVANSLSEEVPSEEAVKAGGIGLPNVKRRLDLLYPRRYDLDIKESKDAYRVSLSLELE